MTFEILFVGILFIVSLYMWIIYRDKDYIWFICLNILALIDIFIRYYIDTRFPMSSSSFKIVRFILLALNSFGIITYIILGLKYFKKNRNSLIKIISREDKKF